MELAELEMSFDLPDGAAAALLDPEATVKPDNCRLVKAVSRNAFPGLAVVAGK